MLSFKDFYHLQEAKSFVGRPTHDTFNKVAVKDMQNDFINKRRSTPNANELLYGVVGDASGLEAHLQEAATLGYSRHQVRYFDRDADTVEALRNRWSKLFPGEEVGNKILHQSLSPSSTSPDPDAHLVTHLDFDITGALQEHPQEVMNVVMGFKQKYNNLKSMVYVFSQRAKRHADDIIGEYFTTILSNLDDNAKNKVIKILKEYLFEKQASKVTPTDVFLLRLQKMMKESKMAGLIVPYAGRLDTPMLSVTIIFDYKYPTVMRKTTLLQSHKELEYGDAFEQIKRITQNQDHTKKILMIAQNLKGSYK